MMSLWDKFFGEFIDVIEWLDDTHDTMVYRFERYNNEIKYGAKLIVRESQVAVFVNEGQIADILEAGTYELETKNMPVMTTLNHWDHGFNSPFKAEIYFINTKQFVNLKWGTKNPIMLRDPEFGMVRIRSFGSYSLRVSDSRRFLGEIVGTDSLFETGEIDEQLRNIIASRFAEVVASLDLSILDMAANYNKIGEYLGAKIHEEFEEYGLNLTKLLVENITLPSSVEASLDKRSSMEITGDLDRYVKYQSAEALAKSGEGNSVMSDAMGFGVGMALADSMKQAYQGKTPPPLPTSKTTLYYVELSGRSSGPYSYDSIVEMLQRKKITTESLIWHSKMEGWGKLADEIDLPDILTPPPLPNS
jgi:membrane protease subunit (stomatin/prohibitin family)